MYPRWVKISFTKESHIHRHKPSNVEFTLPVFRRKAELDCFFAMASRASLKELTRAQTSSIFRSGSDNDSILVLRIMIARDPSFVETRTMTDPFTAARLQSSLKGAFRSARTVQHCESDWWGYLDRDWSGYVRRHVCSHYEGHFGLLHLICPLRQTQVCSGAEWARYKALIWHETGLRPLHAGPGVFQGSLLDLALI